MYEVGKIYIWQNQVGEYAYLNGTETTVLKGPDPTLRRATGKVEMCWETDSHPPSSQSITHYVMVAFVGDLRPKDPPKGEKIIMELFKQPERETA